MAGYNKILLMGNLTRDPELKYLPSNTPVVEFGLAVNRKFKRADGSPGEEVLFVDCNAFARTAEVINQYFHKGDPIFIEGRLQLDTWQDKQTGDKRSKHRVNIENFQFVGGRGGEGGGGAGGPGGSHERSQSRPSAPQRSAAPAGGGYPPPQEPGSDYVSDDIPF